MFTRKRQKNSWTNGNMETVRPISGSKGTTSNHRSVLSSRVLRIFLEMPLIWAFLRATPTYSKCLCRMDPQYGVNHWLFGVKSTIWKQAISQRMRCMQMFSFRFCRQGGYLNRWLAVRAISGNQSLFDQRFFSQALLPSILGFTTMVHVLLRRWRLWNIRIIPIWFVALNVLGTHIAQ